MENKRLQEVVEQISVSEEARQRILRMDRKREEAAAKRRRIRGGLSAACAVFLLAVCASAILGTRNVPQWGIIAYAQGAKWVRLEPGERVLLHRREADDIYELELELPDNYYYEKEGVTLGLDYIYSAGKTIYWRTEDEEPEVDFPDVMTTSMYITILDENREETDKVILEMTKEYDKCYIELKEED